MSDKDTFEVSPGPWGSVNKPDGRVEINLPGNVTVEKVKPDMSGGLFFSNGEKFVLLDQMNENGVGFDVNVHGGPLKTEINFEDFKPTLNEKLSGMLLKSWPEGSMLLRSLVIHGILSFNGVEYRVLKDNGEPVQIAKDHYMYIPVKEGNMTDYSDKD